MLSDVKYRLSKKKLERKNNLFHEIFYLEERNKEVSKSVTLNNYAKI